MVACFEAATLGDLLHGQPGLLQQFEPHFDPLMPDIGEGHLSCLAAKEADQVRRCDRDDLGKLIEGERLTKMQRRIALHLFDDEDDD